MELRLFRTVDGVASRLMRGPIRRPELPDFLGIGAAKSGTTWVYRNLRRHPQLHLPHRKELHYFNHRWRSTLSLRFYAGYFRGGQGKVRGEFTPAYAILPPAQIRYIHSIMPDLRLIFMMRDPIDRAWSHICAHMRVAGRRIEEVPKERLLKMLSRRGMVERSDYGTSIDRWLDVFPREQLLVGFYEELTEAPEALLKRIFRHLGVTTDVDWDLFPARRVLNINPKLQKGKNNFGPCPPSIRKVLGSRFPNDYQGLKARFGHGSKARPATKPSRIESAIP